MYPKDCDTRPVASIRKDSTKGKKAFSYMPNRTGCLYGVTNHPNRRNTFTSRTHRRIDDDRRLTELCDVRRLMVRSRAIDLLFR